MHQFLAGGQRLGQEGEMTERIRKWCKLLSQMATNSDLVSAEFGDEPEMVRAWQANARDLREIADYLSRSEPAADADAKCTDAPQGL